VYFVGYIVVLWIGLMHGRWDTLKCFALFVYMMVKLSETFKTVAELQYCNSSMRWELLGMQVRFKENHVWRTVLDIAATNTAEVQNYITLVIRGLKLWTLMAS